MSKQHRRVMLIDGDPLVLEGLKLLLQDMHCDVNVVRNHQALQQVLDTNADCPQLIIAPVELEDGVSGVYLINQLRTRYKTTIPAILLANDHDFEVGHSDRPSMIYLSVDLNPANLKKIITNLLDYATMPE